MAELYPSTVAGSAKPQCKVVAYNAFVTASRGYENIPAAMRVAPSTTSGSNDSLVVDSIVRAPFDLSPDVISVRTEKSINPGTPSGSFQILLVDRPPQGFSFRSWMEGLDSGDIIFIAINDGGPTDPWTAVMWGAIDRVGRVMEVNGNRGERKILVTGRDLGKWFQDVKLDFKLSNFATYGTRAADLGNSKNMGLEDRQQAIGFAGTAPENVYNCLTTYVMPQHLGIASMIVTDVAPKTGFDEYMALPFNISELDGVAWESLEQMAFRPFCEMWCDTANEGNFVFHHRRTPYDASDWTKLRTWSMDPRHIHGFNMGYGDYERVNFVALYPNIGGSDLSELRLFKDFVRCYIASISVHGLRPLTINSRYFNFARATQVPLVGGDFNNEAIQGNAFAGAAERPGSSEKDTVAGVWVRLGDELDSRWVERSKYSWLQTLWTWNSVNHLLANGNVETKGYSRIKVGDRVVLPALSLNTLYVPSLIYYVINVAQEFSFPNSFRTTLQVQRGQSDAFAQAHQSRTAIGGAFDGIVDATIAQNELINRATIFPKAKTISPKFFLRPEKRMISEHGDTVDVGTFRPEDLTKPIRSPSFGDVGYGVLANSGQNTPPGTLVLP